MNRERNRLGRLASVEPWASVIGGGALAVYGASRKSVPGAALAAVGGYLVYHGATVRGRRPVHVEVSYTINRSPEELFRFWRNFSNLPRFMSHLQSVEATSGYKSRWTIRAPMGSTVSWDADLTEERENRFLVWRSVPGSDLDVRGSVEFRPAPGDRGTEVIIVLRYAPPAGKIGEAVATLLRQSPEQQIREDLRHFKQLMEAGEIPTTEGQPHGRRSALVKGIQRLYGEPQPWRSQQIPRIA